MTVNQRAGRLGEFVSWVKAHITGDEKGEAQIFLDRLFQAFGWLGLKEAGATCELRVKKDGGGTSFADLVWKPIVVIEMKRRGTDLSRHYRQAFDYWTRLVPHRPRFAVLCDFDEFWVYDFETQMDTPVDKVGLADLPARFGPLMFLFPENESPVFGDHHETVTRQAADKLAACFNSLTARNVERSLAQRFTLQMLMALFAQDIGLLEKYFVTRLLEECRTPSDSYDTIGGLFVAMNTPGSVRGGRFKDVAYFNGGLFASPARIELESAELDLLRVVAKFDWSKVSPEIFGTLFEHSLGQEERHVYGAHFTSPVDIMKIVGPTIVEPWREAIESATTKKKLRVLLKRIESFTVLDPACGSGNFLYIAYRELKRLEARIYERIGEKSKKFNPAQRPFGFMTTRNFYGMDVNPFAIEIAKVTMMLAHKLAIDELHIRENALPLDNLDTNFVATDALIGADGSRTPWPHSDVLIGNPPFLGAKRLKPERGSAYVNAVRQAYPEVPAMADYCVYWFRRAHDHIKACTVADRFGGRAGLVGTQNIRNNESRIGGLDYIAATGTIIEAVDNQPWSGEANVHVSIANWVKSKDLKLLPKTFRLWFVESTPSLSRRSHPSRGASKQFEVNVRNVDHINSALSDEADVALALRLPCNQVGGRVCQGITPGHDGFVLSDAERLKLLSDDEASAAVIHPYIIGRELLNGSGRAQRYIIDFAKRDLLEAQAFRSAFEHLEQTVLPEMRKQALANKSERASSLDHWWQHWRPRSELLTAIEKIPRYLACSRVTKRPIFAFIDSSVRPGDALQVFAFSDDYSFGILQSHAHRKWFIAKCSKFKSDFRYTAESVFETFPWPQSPTAKQIEAVAEAGQGIRKIRSEFFNRMQGGLRALYRTLELPGKNPLNEAHDRLNAAVREAYGFTAKRDLLQELLDLNRSVAESIASNVTVTGPGIPKAHPNPDRLISGDTL